MVFFSGDKLLGGPQAGIVVGTKELVGKLARHPLARALRADKLTLAALHATLLHYVRNEAAVEVPVWRMIAVPLAELEARAGAMAKSLGPVASVAPASSAIGGGTLPADSLGTFVVSIDTSSVEGGAAALARRLRIGQPAIMSRIEAERVLLDPRTIWPSRDVEVVKAVLVALG